MFLLYVHSTPYKLKSVSHFLSFAYLLQFYGELVNCKPNTRMVRTWIFLWPELRLIYTEALIVSVWWLHILSLLEIHQANVAYIIPLCHKYIQLEPGCLPFWRHCIVQLRFKSHINIKYPVLLPSCHFGFFLRRLKFTLAWFIVLRGFAISNKTRETLLRLGLKRNLLMLLCT